VNDELEKMFQDIMSFYLEGLRKTMENFIHDNHLIWLKLWT